MIKPWPWELYQRTLENLEASECQQTESSGNNNLTWKIIAERIKTLTKKKSQKRYECHYNKNKSKVQAILQKYSSVYSHGIGKGEGIKANLHLNEDVQPVSYTMKPKIEQELENLKFKNGNSGKGIHK